jgi:NAD(P)H dehydrogenase (quinone)
MTHAMRRAHLLAVVAVFACLGFSAPRAAAQAAPPVAVTPSAQAPTPATPPADAPGRTVTVLVAYASMTGATETMAAAVDAGAASVARTRVIRKRAQEVTSDDLLAADAIVIGSAVHNAGMLPEMGQLLDRWPFEQLNGRVGAAFVAAGGTSAGEELTTLGLIAAMLVHRMVIVGGETWQAAFGASAITEEGQAADRQGKVPDRDREEARALGRRVATLAHALAEGGWRSARP